MIDKPQYQTTNPTIGRVNANIPAGREHTFNIPVDGLPVPRLELVIHQSGGLSVTDSFQIMPWPDAPEIAFDVQCFVVGSGEYWSDMEFRAWYSDGDPVPNDVLDEPEWLEPIERAAMQYLRDYYDANNGPDEFTEGQ